VDTVIHLSEPPPEVYRPAKKADTIPLGPPVIRENDPVVICARRFVRALLDDDQGTAKAMISPKWLEEDGISMDTFMVSSLDLIEVPAHSAYIVTDVRSDAVTVLVTTERGYSRYLTVKVSDENGKRYVVPSGADDPCYSIDPWTWPAEPYSRPNP
jgi:hypothetical protein